jgi:SAM-dependent methyltransferase
MVAYLCIAVGLSFLVVIAVMLWRSVFSRSGRPSPGWLIGQLEMNNPFSDIYRPEVIIAHSGIGPGMSVLDVGCGGGRVTVPAARKAGPKGRVVAVGLQQGMIRRA